MLQGKAAIVTGSMSGIGLGIAQVLAQAGANILLNGLATGKRDSSLVQWFDERRQSRLQRRRHVAAEQIRDMVLYALKEVGSVDILVNNAGIQLRRRSKNFRSRNGTR